MSNKKRQIRFTIDKGARLKQYFLRGHNAWFALAFSILNFTLIFNNLLVKNLDFVPDYLKSYATFFLVFGFFYFPTAALVGYLDFKKGTFAAEQNLTKEISPIWQEVFSRLEQIEKNQKKILETQSDKN